MTPRLVAPFVLVAVTAACSDGDRSMFVTENERAEMIARLGAVTLVGFTLVGLAMWALLVWLAARRRGSFQVPGTAEVHDSRAWIIAGGIVLPGVTFLALLLVSLGQLGAAAPARVHHGHGPGEERAEIRITGKRWWWKVEYVGVPPAESVVGANEVHIPAGRPVDVELLSGDVIHSFWVPNLGGKVDLVPGRTNWITLHVRTPGVYRGQCAEYCGMQHANMRLLVIAHEPEEYERWLDHQRQPALPPTTRLAIRGKEVFESQPCAVCHQIRGTRAHGAVGPDLTHVAGRRMIGANLVPFERGFLGAWITRAHALKPGAQMPNLTTMTGPDLRALVHYLEVLE